MKPFFPIALIFAACLAFAATAQEETSWEIQALNHFIPGTVEGKVEYNLADGTATGTNGVYVKYQNVALTAHSVALNMKTGDVEADGGVRIESGDMLWVGDHVHYNFRTKQMRTEQFRTGRSPVFASGTDLAGNTTNKVYTAENGAVTADDLSDPAYQVRASRIKVIPGKRVEMWNAVVWLHGVPVFYLPYYSRNIGHNADNWTPKPGYNTLYGPYVLNTYRWFLGDDADGKFRLDYRGRRGVGFGPEAAVRAGDWGDFNLKYYYTYDQKPDSSTNAFPQYGNIDHNRQVLNFNWQATPATNLNFKALVNYQSDPLVTHDFFPGDYSGNPQPGTFVEANKYWDNWSLDALATPRVNNFFDQVERLPDVRLDGLRQEVAGTPVYYDSQSSAGWYQQFTSYANTNTTGLYPGTNGYNENIGTRADTYHQLTLPWTFFHWLNVTPRVGGRVTYYNDQSITNQGNTDTWRRVFNTGVDTSFKASHLWTGATNALLDVDGIRHIIEPSASYVFVPTPSTSPNQLPQFDAQQPTLLPMPNTFPDYNNIDSIGAESAFRLGLRNTLQTKRSGTLDNLVACNLQIDCRLNPQYGQKTWDDLYSEIAIKPRSWLTAESQDRYDLNTGDLNMAFEQLTFAPGDRWSWGVGYFYLRAGTWGGYNWGENNALTSALYYKLNENWGLRMTDNYNAVDGRLQEQGYTIYRDLRSWTAAFTFRVVNNQGSATDYTVGVTFSLKAQPVARLGDDVANRYHIISD